MISKMPKTVEAIPPLINLVLPQRSAAFGLGELLDCDRKRAETDFR